MTTDRSIREKYVRTYCSRSTLIYSSPASPLFALRTYSTYFRTVRYGTYVRLTGTALEGHYVLVMLHLHCRNPMSNNHTPPPPSGKKKKK